MTHKNVSNFGTELLSVFSKQTFFSETYTSRLIFLTLTDILTVEVFVRVYQRVRFYLPSSINFRYISGFPKLGAHNPYLGSLQGSRVVPLDSTDMISYQSLIVPSPYLAPFPR